MNRDEIIRMAVDAGIIPWTKHEYVGGKNFSASDEGLDGDLASLIQFAALVASAERSACAKLCDDMEEKAEGVECCKWPTPIDCAYAIRARGAKHD